MLRLMDSHKRTGLRHYTITPADMGGFNATQFSGQVTIVDGGGTTTFNYSLIGEGSANAYEYRSIGASRGAYIYRDGNNLAVDQRNDDGTSFDGGNIVITSMTLQIMDLSAVAYTGDVNDLNGDLDHPLFVARDYDLVALNKVAFTSINRNSGLWLVNADQGTGPGNTRS